MDDRVFSRALCGERLFLVKLARQRFNLSTADAEDAAQEACCKAWANRDRYAEQAKFRGWLVMIMFNHILSTKRRARRVILTDNDLQLDGVAPAGQEPALFLKQVNAAIRLLTPDHRDAIELGAQGVGFLEMGERKGVPAGTMKSRLHRARQNLKAMVA